MKDVLRSALRGISSTFVIVSLFSLIFETDPELKKLIISTYLLGGIIGGCSAIYKSERLPLMYQTLIHLGISLICFLVIARWNEWFPFDMWTIFGASLVFLIIFIVIWVITYYLIKKEIEEINRDLQ